MVDETDRCEISADFNVITAQCALSSNFQVIAQQDTDNEVHKLYNNHSATPNSPVTVLVSAGGYQVSIFAIREGSGIMNSNVQYTDHVIVTAAMTTTVTAIRPTASNTGMTVT